jgi:signal transduction histidine kinase
VDNHRPVDTTDILSGGGELGALMRSKDWSTTPLGPPQTWPQSLKTSVRIMLTSRQPMFVWWGDELINLYNDAYKTIVGGKHPQALGQPAAAVWWEIWDQVRPRAESAMRKNEGTYDEALLLIMERNGYPEETYYTFSYSPVPNDQGGPGGIICANTDDTQRIIGERQLALLRELATKTAHARTWQDACTLSTDALAVNPYDLPFTMLYLVETECRRVFLAGTSGIERGHWAAPETVALGSAAGWPFAEVIRTHDAYVVSNLHASFGGLPTGAWPRPPTQVVALPIAPSGQTGKAGVLVVGLNPFRLFDDNYRGFLRLVAGQIAASIANAQAYEEEKRRAEALAQIDRAKTMFFSNVSHEFRTPLTLILGPVEDMLAAADGQLSEMYREQMGTVHRNSLRLLKLVNTLLDFSRIEAGRLQAVFEPTDLATLTADLASVFRSACKRAGVKLVINCPPLSAPAYVDRDMWEKIVLNLLSNAFKYTLQGRIEVQLREGNGRVRLAVCDTGTGIPAAAMPHLFERFYRFEGAKGRTQEGSGIGLALVQELVKMHGGSVAVESTYGQGSTFIVTVPLGMSHLPVDQIGGARTLTSTATGADAYLQEALRWLPDQPCSPAVSTLLAGNAADMPVARSTVRRDGRSDDGAARVLLADDNADMRDYVRRLLEPYWEVEAVADGLAALKAARRQKPDLVLTDVMMPRLDGFGLLRELRGDRVLGTVPVIMLSARAGEEARVEGLDAGADDYLIKPFSARELLARVGSTLELARVRREAAHRERLLREKAQTALQAAEAANHAKDRFLAVLSHELRTPLTPVLMAVQDMEADEHVPEHIHRELSMIHSNIELEARLIDDLLDLTRIIRGQIALHYESIDLHSVLMHALETCRDTDIAPKRLRVHIELRAPISLLWADAARIEQVFWNLIKNAAKFTGPEGTITIRSWDDGDGRIMVQVADTGIGIAPDLMARLFNAFEQGEPEVTRQYGGLGLGLAISKAIVDLHNGSIRAESAGPGKGTTMTVTLPRVTAPSGHVSGFEEPGQWQRVDGVLRILLVEDDKSTLGVMARLLSKRGHHVAMAATVHEALTLAEGEGFDLLISDLGLPDGTGHELMRVLRQTRGLKGIALSGYGMEEDIRLSYDAGFDTHLTKPVNLKMLEAAIARVSAVH